MRLKLPSDTCFIVTTLYAHRLFLFLPTPICANRNVIIAPLLPDEQNATTEDLKMTGTNSGESLRTKAKPFQIERVPFPLTVW